MNTLKLLRTGMAVILIPLISSCATICNKTIGLINPLVCVIEFRDASFGKPITKRELSEVRDDLVRSLGRKYVVDEKIPNLDKGGIVCAYI
jgi:hypothetical protein